MRRFILTAPGKGQIFGTFFFDSYAAARAALLLRRTQGYAFPGERVALEPVKAYA